MTWRTANWKSHVKPMEGRLGSVGLLVESAPTMIIINRRIEKVYAQIYLQILKSILLDGRIIGINIITGFPNNVFVQFALPAII